MIEKKTEDHHPGHLESNPRLRSLLIHQEPNEQQQQQQISLKLFCFAEDNKEHTSLGLKLERSPFAPDFTSKSRTLP